MLNEEDQEKVFEFYLKMGPAESFTHLGLLVGAMGLNSEKLAERLSESKLKRVKKIKKTLDDACMELEDCVMELIHGEEPCSH